MQRLHKVAHFNFGASLCLTELESLPDGSMGANERAIEILSRLLHFNAVIDPKKSKQRPRLLQDPSSFFGSPIIDSIYNYQRYVHRWEERINQSLVRLGPYPPKITFHQVWSISPFSVSRVRHLQRTASETVFWLERFYIRISFAGNSLESSFIFGEEKWDFITPVVLYHFQLSSKENRYKHLR